MKLDKITFARLAAMIASEYNHIQDDFIEALDRLIDVEVPQQATIEIYPKNENVERLMSHMAAGTNKIDAIREHRAITGMGLRDSKDAVERYWPDNSKKYSAADLRSKLNTKVWDVTSYAAIDKFITELGD